MDTYTPRDRTSSADIALLLSFCAFFFFVAAEFAFARTVFVHRVEESGTIAVSSWPNAEREDELIRMYGVRYPTMREPYGREARAFLMRFLHKGAKIEVSPVERNTEDGLEEVLVQVAGHSLNYALVDEGLAWVDRRSCKSSYCRRWYIVEHNAVMARKGLWSMDPETPPWQWSR